MRRPFSETHIARNIRVRQLGSVAEEQPISPTNTTTTHPGDETDGSVQSTEGTDDLPASSRTSVSNLFTDKTSAPNIYPDPESITAETLTSHTFTANDPPCDLLVRTSGVRRLSDFMLWQCHQDTSIVFLDCLWPDFDLWQFLPVLVEWQWKQRKMEELRKPSRASVSRLSRSA